MLSYKAEGTLQMWLRTWRWEDYPRASGWALNEITSIIIEGRPGELWLQKGEEEM